MSILYPALVLSRDGLHKLKRNESSKASNLAPDPTRASANPTTLELCITVHMYGKYDFNSIFIY